MSAIAEIGPADRAFLEISPRLAREDNPVRILDLALSGAMALTDATAGRAFFLDRELRHLHCGATRPSKGAKVCVDPLDIEAAGLVDNPLIYCLRTGRPVRIADLHRHNGFDCAMLTAWWGAVEGEASAVLVVPLRDHSGGAVGALVLHRLPSSARETPEFSESEALHLQRFTEHAATAVVAARLLMDNERLDTVPRTPAITEGESFGKIVGNSPRMREALALARRVAPTDIGVLLTGETGTGKEVVAQAIHDASCRAQGPFIAQNCAAIPETLLEAELFGWTRGAFSGAVEARDGLFVRATGGTLLLDEIGDMPLGLQAKLLRVLQEQRVRPLGGADERAVDVRIIAATHHDLKGLVEQGAFRADLYYRLATFPLDLPPLRHRTGDIPLLVQHFLRETRGRLGGPLRDFSPEGLALLEEHEWPGNVRELRNMVERAVLLDQGGSALLVPSELQASDQGVERGAGASLPLSHEGGDAITVRWAAWNDLPLRDAVARFETEVIRHRLEGAGGNQREAARALGLPRRTLADKIRRYGLDGV